MTYYYKEDSDMYHWHFGCSFVPTDVRKNLEWKVTETKPSGREQCNECKTKHYF